MVIISLSLGQQYYGVEHERPKVPRHSQMFRKTELGSIV